MYISLTQPLLRSLLAQVQPRNARVVIADLAVIVLPGVEMHVLIPDVASSSWTHVHVVEGLAVHVEEVGVALADGDLSNLVEVSEAGHVGEDPQRLNLDKVVEVSGGDDVRLGVLREDLGDEVLRYPVSSFHCSQISGHVEYGLGIQR